jgi:hypothetical protein
MSCTVCGDKGIVKVCYEDGTPADYAVCLCPASAWYRSDVNAGKHTGSYGWQVWAAREQIQPDCVFGLEDVYEPSELATMVLAALKEPTAETREAALIAAGKTKKRTR